MITDQYASEIRGSLDHLSYCRLIDAIGDKLNSRKDRFDKSDIIEKSVSIYTESKLKYVDQIGYDFLDTHHNYKVEFKYITNAIRTAKGKERKVTRPIRLKNSLGQQGCLSSLCADYYIISQQNAMSIISFKDLLPYAFVTSDALVAKIPINKLSFVFTNYNFSNTSNIDVATDYLERKNELQLELIRRCQHG